MKTQFGREAKHGDYVIATITYSDGWQSYGVSVLGRVSNGKVYTTMRGDYAKVDEATIVIDEALVSEQDKKIIEKNIEDYDFVKFERRLHRTFRKKKKELAGG